MRRSVIAAIPQRRRWQAIALAHTVSGVFAAFACGGTNGHEGLPSAAPPAAADGSLGNAGNDGTATDSASGEAIAPDAATGNGIDATTFDVQIMYADRVLPDITPATMQTAGGEGGTGYPWPNCPPFVAVLRNGKPTAFANAVDEIPASYDDKGNVLLDDAGHVVPASDASPCGSYPWLGSTAIDKCTTPLPNLSYAILPPCSWCIDAGNALAGPRAGDPRYNICMDLYACIRRTGCGLAPDNFTFSACLCGDSGVNCTGGGACETEELAALEFAADPMSIIAATKVYSDTAMMSSGWCGSHLNYLFELAFTGMDYPSPSGCFPPDAGPF